MSYRSWILVIFQTFVVCFVVIGWQSCGDSPADAPATGYFIPAEPVLRTQGDYLVNEAEVIFVDSQGKEWVAPAGTKTDGATIPQWALSLMGGRMDSDFRYAALIHDAYCQSTLNGEGSSFRTKPWEDVHRMFYEACLSNGVGPKQARIMFAAVWSAGPRWGEDEADDSAPLTHVQTAMVYEVDLNIEDWNAVFDLDFTFPLGDVYSIDSVTLELANAASRDVAVYLVAPALPDQPVSRISLTGGGRGAATDFFGLGQNGHILDDVLPYMMVDKNAPKVADSNVRFMATSSFDQDGSLAAGIYKVSGWIHPPTAGMWPAGEWKLDFADHGSIDADPVGAVGRVTVNYHGAPQPKGAPQQTNPPPSELTKQPSPPDSPLSEEEQARRLELFAEVMQTIETSSSVGLHGDYRDLDGWVQVLNDFEGNLAPAATSTGWIKATPVLPEPDTLEGQ